MTLTGRDDSRTTPQTNERKKCNNIPRSKREVTTTDIRTNVDNARDLTGRVTGRCDPSRTVTSLVIRCGSVILDNRAFYLVLS